MEGTRGNQAKQLTAARKKSTAQMAVYWHLSGEKIVLFHELDKFCCEAARTTDELHTAVKAEWQGASSAQSDRNGPSHVGKSLRAQFGHLQDNSD